MKHLIKMIDTELRLLRGERREIDTRVRSLEKAKAALKPPKVLTRTPKRKRTAARKGSALNKVDKGLSKTILTMLKQREPQPGDLGLKATDIVEVLQGRGFMFTSRFPSRSVSGLLTIMHKQGKVTRTPKGKPRIYHYKAVTAGPASVPASSVPSEEVPLAAETG